MAKVAIVADDLTGANATSVLLVRQGFRSSTFLNLDKYRQESADAVDVISISTDSRGLESKMAYDRVRHVMEKLDTQTMALFSKRIDSTLRGNIGMEIQAMLDCLPDHLAVVVSAFPASGRVCIGGYHLVHQIPLENTDVGRDPKTPVRHSKVETIIREQFSGEIASIHLNTVLKGPDSIRSELQEISQRGARLVIIDATTDQDITHIARAVKESSLKAVAVDPGPFTAALAREVLGQPHLTPGKKILVTIGSVSNLTRRQIERMRLKYDPLIYQADARAMLEEHTLELQGQKAKEFLLNGFDDHEILGIVTTASEEEVLNLNEVAREYGCTEEDISNRISQGLARITKDVLEAAGGRIGGLYTSGGDVTVSVCNRLNASGIVVKDEVLPLAVYGRLLEGEYDNFPIITKGGLVGEDDALIQCVEYLLTKISSEYYSL